MPTQFAVEKKPKTRKAPAPPPAPVEEAAPAPPPVAEAPAPADVRRDVPPEAVEFAAMLDERAAAAPVAGRVFVDATDLGDMKPVYQPQSPELRAADQAATARAWGPAPFGPTWPGGALWSPEPRPVAGTATTPAQEPPMEAEVATPPPVRGVSGRDLTVAGLVVVVGLALAAQVGPRLGTVAGGLFATPTPFYAVPPPGPQTADPAPDATEAAPADAPPVATPVGDAPAPSLGGNGREAALPQPTATAWPTAVPPTPVPPTATPVPPTQVPWPSATPHVVAPHPPTATPVPPPTLIPAPATTIPATVESGGAFLPGATPDSPVQVVRVG